MFFFLKTIKHNMVNMCVELRPAAPVRKLDDAKENRIAEIESTRSYIVTYARAESNDRNRKSS